MSGSGPYDLEPFVGRFPDVERRDRRVLTVRRHPILGDMECSLIEFYSVHPNMDDRHAMLSVITPASPLPEAWISVLLYPIEEGDDGLALDPLHPQRSRAGAILEEVRELVSDDESVLALWQEHYVMIKAAAAAEKRPEPRQADPDVQLAHLRKLLKEPGIGGREPTSLLADLDRDIGDPSNALALIMFKEPDATVRAEAAGLLSKLPPARLKPAADLIRSYTKGAADEDRRRAEAMLSSAGIPVLPEYQVYARRMAEAQYDPARFKPTARDTACVAALGAVGAREQEDQIVAQLRAKSRAEGGGTCACCLVPKPARELLQMQLFDLRDPETGVWRTVGTFACKHCGRLPTEQRERTIRDNIARGLEIQPDMQLRRV